MATLSNGELQSFFLGRKPRARRSESGLLVVESSLTCHARLAQGLDTITSVTNALRFFLTSVAAIALVVGGIGIMNIMLAAVQERTREIGLRKAVGAHSRHIIVQFLVETVMITLMGGVIGILLGSIISYVVGRVAISMNYNWDIIISFSSILLSCFVSVSIGLIFGIVPARRASRLNPIEALRYE